MIYLARLESGEVQLRSDQPSDTQSWLGPYAPSELWTRLAPAGNPLNRPELKSKPEEHAGSYGLRPIDFAAKYDPESKSIILFDFGGYVGTVSTPESLWKALIFQSNHGIGSLRSLTRVPEVPNGKWLSPEEQAEINRQIAETMERANKPENKPAKKVTLEDLGL